MEKAPFNASGGRMTEHTGMFTIAAAECKRIKLAFRMNVSHNLASRIFTENILVEIVSDAGLSGFGESIPRKYVTGETIETVLDTAPVLLSILKEKRFSSPGEIRAVIDELSASETGGRNPAALCAVELALLDLAGRVWDMSASDIVGLEKNSDPMRYSLIVPFMDDEIFEYYFMQAKDFGFKHVKIKVEAEDPVRLVNRVRNYFGDDIEIRVDANCAWNRSNAECFMRALADIGVVSVEQPLAANDLEGSAYLRSLGLMQITLDESVNSIASIRRIAEHEACDIVNVRISKCGGIIGSMNIIKSARKYGIDIQLGAHVGESCILSAAGAHLAAGNHSFRWLEGSFGKHLLKNSLCTEEIQFSRGGMMNSPEGPGLGFTIDRDLVNEVTVGSISV